MQPALFQCPHFIPMYTYSFREVTGLRYPAIVVTLPIFATNLFPLFFFARQSLAEVERKLFTHVLRDCWNQSVRMRKWSARDCISHSLSKSRSIACITIQGIGILRLSIIAILYWKRKGPKGSQDWGSDPRASANFFWLACSTYLQVIILGILRVSL